MDLLVNPDAGIACTTLASQNSFVGAYSLADNSFHLTGTVATYSGVGMYLQPCLDASAFSGIQFTVSGDVGNGAAAGDSGTAGQMTFQVFQPSNVMTAAGNLGKCAMNCNPPSLTFNVTSTPTSISVKWSQLTGGTPIGTIDSPGQITGLQWQYNWPCAPSPTTYMTNVTIANVQFTP